MHTKKIHLLDSRRYHTPSRGGSRGWLVTPPPGAAAYFMLLLCVWLKLFRCRFVPLLEPNPSMLARVPKATPSKKILDPPMPPRSGVAPWWVSLSIRRGPRVKSLLLLVESLWINIFFVSLCTNMTLPVKPFSTCTQSERVATPSEKGRATATGNVRKNFVKTGRAIPEMLASRYWDRRAHDNTSVLHNKPHFYSSTQNYNNADKAWQ